MNEDEINLLELSNLLSNEDILISENARKEIWKFIEKDIEPPINAKITNNFSIALKSFEAKTRRCAARALGQLSDQAAIESLIPLIADIDADVRYAALCSLARLGDQRSIIPLLAILTRGSDFLTLMTGQEDDFLPVLRQKLSSLAKDRKDGRSEDILKIDLNSLRQLAENTGSPFMGHTAYVLSRLGGVIVEPFLQILHFDPENAHNRLIMSYAAAALHRIDNPSTARETLKDALNDENALVRWAAARALAKCPNSAVVEALLDTLADSDDEVRLAAAYALGNLKDIRAVERVLNLLKERLYPLANALPPITSLTKFQWRFIGSRGEGCKALQHDDSQAKIELAAALVKLGDPNAIPLVLEVVWEYLQLDPNEDRSHVYNLATAWGSAALPYLDELLRRNGADRIEIEEIIGEIKA